MPNSSYPRGEWGNLKLKVISPAELKELPDGTPLACIDGSIAVKGRDRIDLDTRFGFLAYGFLEPHPTRRNRRSYLDRILERINRG